jgi:hypothetical protein
MENLENLIHNNSSKFDVYEPDKEHLDRFKSKLGKTSQHKHYFKLVLMLAAGFLLLFSISMVYVAQNKNNAMPQLSDMSPEYREVESYYNVELTHKLSELNTIKCQKAVSDSSVYKQLTVLTNEYHNLQRDLASSEYDERIVSAMITNYQIRIDLVETVIKTAKLYCR